MQFGGPGRNFPWRCFWVSEVEGSGTGFGCVRSTDRGQLLRWFPQDGMSRDPWALEAGGGARCWKTRQRCRDGPLEGLSEHAG